MESIPNPVGLIERAILLRLTTLRIQRQKQSNWNQWKIDFSISRGKDEFYSWLNFILRAFFHTHRTKKSILSKPTRSFVQPKNQIAA
jgi:hypothetical protein